MTTSPNLNLPFVAAGQAQKHVTVNEAVLAVDSLMHLAVDGAPADAPPSDPEQGSRWIVGSTPTGDWTGKAGRLAVFLDGGWRFHTPRSGWLVHVAETQTLLAYDGTGWSALATPTNLQQVERLGLATDADAANPLSARLNGALLTALPTADGGDDDLRLKLNKSGATDTVSLIYQSGFSGRAEIGLAGSDDLSVRVSPDGSAWTTSLIIDKDDGSVRMPCNPKFRASLNYDAYVAANTWTRLPFNVAAHDPLSGFDVVDHDYTAPIDGFYLFGAQVGHHSDGTPPTTAYAAVYVNGTMAEESEMRCVAVNNNRGIAVLTLARYLTAGTTVDVRVYFDTNDSELDDAGCQFWGVMIA